MEADSIWEEVSKKYGPFGSFKETHQLGMTKHWMDLEYYLDRWDIPEKVIIGVASVGNFVTANQNPNQPLKHEKLVKQLRACIDLGASSVHVHARDAAGNRLDYGPIDKALVVYRSILGEVRKHSPSIVVEGGGGFYLGQKFEDTIRSIKEGKFDVAYIHPIPGLMGDGVTYFSPKFDPQALAEYCERTGVKPCIDIQDTHHILLAKKWLVEPGIVRKPTFWHILGPGPAGFIYMPNTKAMIQGLIFLVDQIRSVDPDAVIYVSMNGRATFYISVLAMIMGLHVRVGMEDTVWKYPHKDDRIESNVDIVKQTIEVARYLGRKPATPDEYRKIVGLRRHSRH